VKISNEKILSVPTNVISGFLGAGKTTAIMHLLQQKPSNERWAILVNEFGEIGIDGSLFNGLINNTSKVFIKEVPGGCMCCASSLPMQVALNQLLKKAKPHRLLIEPTGLGHPLEVLELLSNEYYQKSLSLEKTLTLVDARHLNDCRFTEHSTFNQQLQVADVIIGNKVDLYDDQDKEALIHYIRDHGYTTEPISFIERAKVKLEWLAGKTNYKSKNDSKKKYHHHSSTIRDLNTEPPVRNNGFIKTINQGEDYYCIGWKIAPEKIFNQAHLLAFLREIVAIRVKAVFITNNGVYSYNNTADGIQEIKLDVGNESRIEIICDNIDETWEYNLMKTLVK
jgi:G3E family GTPase